MTTKYELERMLADWAAAEEVWTLTDRGCLTRQDLIAEQPAWDAVVALRRRVREHADMLLGERRHRAASAHARLHALTPEQQAEVVELARLMAEEEK